jgi:hypothetical protein
MSKHGSCTKLCLKTLFLRINYLFNQTIIKTDTHKNNCIKSKQKKIIIQGCTYSKKYYNVLWKLK